MKKSEILLGLLRIPCDIMGIMAGFIFAYIIRRDYPNLLPGIELSSNLEVFQPWNDYLAFAAAATTFLIILFAANKLYSFKVNTTLQREILQVIQTTFSWLTMIIVFFFITRNVFFSRLVLAYSLVLIIGFVIISRSLIRIIEYILLKNNIGKRRILIIGANDITEKLYHYFKNNKRYFVVGVIADTKTPANASYAILAPFSELENIIMKKKVDEIIQTTDKQKNNEASDILDVCRTHHMTYSFVPNILNIQQKNIEVYPISGIPLIKLNPTPLDGWGRVAKRIFDISMSSILLLMLSPFMAIIALAIKIDSKGTIIFKYLDDGSLTKRVGQHGELFRFHKFRTMYPNTHNLRYTTLAHKNIRKGTPMVKIKDDPRVTKVGKFLRKTSLDELPQLWNVLTGHMSLVGPRAHLPEEVEQYQKHHKFVLTIKPGITGLAQVSGRSDLDFEEEVRLDRYYIENWSLFQDIKILIKTAFILFNRIEAD